jgi:hypothetical protein
MVVLGFLLLTSVAVDWSRWQVPVVEQVERRWGDADEVTLALPAIHQVYEAYGLGHLVEKSNSWSSSNDSAVQTEARPPPARRYRAIVLLSEMCSGSSIVQEYATLNSRFASVDYTPMFEHELNFFGQVATLLDLPDIQAPLAPLHLEAPMPITADGREEAVSHLVDLLLYNGVQRKEPHDRRPLCDEVEVQGGEREEMTAAACQAARELPARLRAAVAAGATTSLIVPLREAFCALVHLRGGFFFEKTPQYLTQASAVAALAVVRESVRALNSDGRDDGSLCVGLSIDPVLLVRNPVDVALSANRRWNDDPGYDLRRWTWSYSPWPHLATTPPFGPALPILHYEAFVEDPTRALAPLLGDGFAVDTSRGVALTGDHGPVAVQRHGPVQERRGEPLLALLDETARADLLRVAASFGLTEDEVRGR